MAEGDTAVSCSPDRVVPFLKDLTFYKKRSYPPPPKKKSKLWIFVLLNLWYNFTQKNRYVTDFVSLLMIQFLTSWQTDWLFGLHFLSFSTQKRFNFNVCDSRQWGIFSVKYHGGRVQIRSGLGVKTDFYSIVTDHTRCVRLFCVKAPSKPE